MGQRVVEWQAAKLNFRLMPTIQFGQGASGNRRGDGGAPGTASEGPGACTLGVRPQCATDWDNTAEALAAVAALSKAVTEMEALRATKKLQ
jgi:hypothetical protein